MSKLSPAALILLFLIVTFGTGAVTWLFYGDLPPVPSSQPILLWVVAVICAIAGWWIRKILAGNHGVGLARGQVHPVSIARWLVVAQAVAVTGTVCGGLYTGICLFVVTQAHRLAAAAAEAPLTIAAALGGIAMAAAGVYLERGCATPPPTDATPA